MTVCKNCGEYFTQDEMARMKPPIHPWRLSPNGQKVAQENEAAGDARRCPRCGNTTLRG